MIDGVYRHCWRNLSRLAANQDLSARLPVGAKSGRVAFSRMTAVNAAGMCAMFVTIAVLAIDRNRPFVAALALVASAYSHYYGVLFFPFLLLNGRSAGGSPAGPPPARRRFRHSPASRRRSSRRAGGAT